MTRGRQLALARAGAIAAAAVAIVCSSVMVADYSVARSRQAHDDRRLAELQAAARLSPEAARTLDAERDGITRSRLARRARTGSLSIVLIAASAAFVVCAKWRIALGPRRPPSPPLPVRKAIKLRTLEDAPIRYDITGACNGCTLCAQACRTAAIAYRPYEKHEIDDSRCTWCDKCVQVCQEGAIQVVVAATGAPAPRPTRPRRLAS